MPKFPNDKFLELFFQEVESYIPGIRQGLETLSSDRTAVAAIQELHRLFHNIKGAASQVRLSDLSNGAKVAESALEILLEEGHPVSDQCFTALNRTTDLLIEYTNNANNHPDGEQKIHEQIVAFFSEHPKEVSIKEMGASDEETQDYLHDVRSIFPLLLELADCLTGDGNDEDHDTAIYGKLSHAVSILSATVLAAGMKQQSQLMHDLHLLLGKLHSETIRHEPEISGLMQDFFGFLEVTFAYGNPENSVTVKRVKEQLRKFKFLLEALSSMEEEPALVEDIEDFDELGIFDDSITDDESANIFEEFVDSGILEEDMSGESAELEEAESVEEVLESADLEEAESVEEILEPQESEAESLDDDQLLLMEIFQEECDEHLIVINQSLNILESKVNEQTDLTPELLATVSDMRRAVHTLKGAASMTGVNLLARAAHSLEDLLDWLHDESGKLNPKEVQILANGIDVIELLSQSPQATESASLDKLVGAVDEYLAFTSQPGSSKDSSSEELLSNLTAKVPETQLVPAGEDVDVIPQPVIEEKTPVALASDSGTVRVKLEDLDELVSIEGELIVARGAMAKMVDEFSHTLFELENVKENLRRKSQELESGFEVQSLYGFNPFAGKSGIDEPIDNELSDFDPIELDRYSQLNLIIRSLNEISVDVNSLHTTMASLAGDIKGQIGKQQLTMRLMQDKLMRIRMTPLSSISRVLFRTVRDTASKLGKKVALTVTGEDVYMDRFVWTKITDPLMHILRNGVDHGIESAELRAVANKPETATINIQAEQHSRFVVLLISDDGAGVNFSRIKDKIKSEGLVENLESLSEKELMEFLFHPSFTTKQDVTTISGRGVGLDVVRRNIEDLGGTVQIRNNPGQGVVFELQIPFTLSVNRAALVSVAGREFAVPLQDILQVKHFSVQEIEDTDGLSLKFGDGVVPVANLGYHLQLEKRMETLETGARGLLVILFMKGEEQHAVAIDSVIEQREIIVKNLGSHLTNVRGISGVTLTGSGGLIPILNLRELVEIHAVDTVVDTEPLLQRDLNEPLKVLIVDDSISVRHSVARLVESQKWQQQQAVDGLDALAKLESFIPDVIILDIEMPKMNGYEFKSSINNQELYKDIPVVMLTSRASEKHQQKARDLGIENYLTKPYEDDSFVQLLESIRSNS